MKRLSDWCGDNFSGGRITELSVYKGDTYKLELEGGQTFFINCAIVADYDLHEGGEMDAELLEKLQPKTAVVTVAARRPDERPHPYVVSLLQEYVENLYFTDAVELPGLVEPQFHKSVHLEVE